MRTILTILAAALVTISLGGCSRDTEGTADTTSSDGSPAAEAPSGTPTEAPTEATPETTADAEKPTRPPTVTETWRGEGAVVEVNVWHLHCAGCEVAIEDEVKGVEGVVDATADHMRSLLTVTLADAGDREAMIGKLREAIHAADRQIVGEDEIALETE